MAKKSSINISEDKDQSVFGLISSIDKSAEILSESKTALIKDYINTGSYILNACMTGSLFKGVPTGRVLTLAGEPGCLKKSEKVEIYIINNIAADHEQREI